MNVNRAFSVKTFKSACLSEIALDIHLFSSTMLIEGFERSILQATEVIGVNATCNPFHIQRILQQIDRVYLNVTSKRFTSQLESKWEIFCCHPRKSPQNFPNNTRSEIGDTFVWT